MKPEEKVLIPPYFGSITTWKEILDSKIIWDIHKNYTKQTYRNRTYIHSANGLQNLIVPIKHSLEKFSMQSAIIDNSSSWRQNHWKSIKTAYNSAPFFEFYEDSLKKLFDTKFTNLLDLNISTIKLISKWLEIEIKYDFSKDYNKVYNSKIDLRGLINYKNKTSIKFKKYNQVFIAKNGFLKDLSILDLIFNVGPNSESILK